MSPPICTDGKLDCGVDTRLLAGRPEQYVSFGGGPR